MNTGQPPTSMTLSKPSDSKSCLKYASLVTLTAQNTALGLSMRYARTRGGEMFFAATAVLMAEIHKLLICLFLVYNDEGRSSRKLMRTLHETVIVNYWDTLKVCIPSAIYVVQNNLLYLAATHLDVATFQVTFQLKILTTAFFAVVILKKNLIGTQWVSLVLLTLGVALVNLSESKEVSAANSATQNPIIGFASVITACFLSGFAGIYFEKILKGSDISVWMRNVQLSLLSIPAAAAFAAANHWTDFTVGKGFFHGYDGFVYYLVLLQAAGGLLVAMAVKYADNILKAFACALAIVVTCVFSMIFFGFVVSLQFSIGTVLVIFSVFLYGYKPESGKK